MVLTQQNENETETKEQLGTGRKLRMSGYALVELLVALCVTMAFCMVGVAPVILGFVGVSGADAIPAARESSQSAPSAQDASSSSASPNSQASSSASSPSAAKSKESRGSASASADERTLKTTIESADGTTYTVALAYGDSAEIPEDAKLSVTEFTEQPDDAAWKQDPAYKGRPLDTEQFKRAKYLADHTAVVNKTLETESDDYVFFTKFLDLAIEANGKTITPADDVEVRVSTDALDATASKAIELAMLSDDEEAAANPKLVKAGRVTQDGKTAEALDAEDVTGEVDEEADEDDEGDESDDDADGGGDDSDEGDDDAEPVTLTFTTDEIGELAIMGIAEAKAIVWQDAAHAVEVLGPRSLAVSAHATKAPALPEAAATGGALADADTDTADPGSDRKSLGAYTFDVKPDQDGDTTLWVRDYAAKSTALSSGALKSATRTPATEVALYRMEDGVIADGPSSLDANGDPLPLTDADAIALVLKAADAASDASDASGSRWSASSGKSGGARSSSSESGKSTSRTGAGTTILTQSTSALDGSAYEVSVTYGPEAGIGEDAKLEVSEFSEIEYDVYTERALEVLDDDAIAYARGFDINIVDFLGRDIEPKAPVAVSITLEDGVELDKANILHFSDGTSDVIAPEMQEVSVGTTYQFTTDSFSAYLVAGVAREQILEATDGHTYKVSVTYDALSGIPADAELSVSEIAEGDAGYDEYVAHSAAALGEKPENLAFARAFDITLKNPRTGEEYEPNSNVQVSIELLEDDLSDYANVDVVHIPDDTAKEAEVMDSTVRGESVEFETDGFSVYVLAGVYTYTYIFYAPKDDATVTETVTETGFTVSNWSSVYSSLSIRTDTGSTSAQIVKNGETPVIPQLQSTEDKVFAGWFEGAYSGSDVSFGKTPYNFDDVEIKENRTINLYARYSTFADVVFHDQYDSALNDYPIMTTRRAELVNGSASVRSDDVEATYSGSGNLAFYGWSETPVKVPGQSGTLVSATDGHITVTGHKDLYPVFQSFHWLSFYSAYTGSGAEYVTQSAYFENDDSNWATSLPVPTWEGHTFLGWFNGDLTTIDNGDGTTTDSVTYSTQITDGTGTFITNVQGTGVGLQGGKLKVTADTTLYAKWSDASVSYKIIIWKQKTTDAAELPDNEKSYDFVESVVKSVPVGTTVSVDSEYTTRSYNGFTYSRCDGEVTVNPSGYTILNVYYDRTSTDSYTSTASHTLTFIDSVTGDGASKNLPVTYSNSTSSAVAYGTRLLTGNSGISFVPADPTSGRVGFSFSGWYADAICSTRVFFDAASYSAYAYSKVLYETMPDEDLTIYAGWSADWYVVQIDPNYGTFNGSGGTWFWETVDGDLIREYTQVTRNYAPSSSGTYYYAKHDRAYYGYSGNQWDNSEKDRDAFYTTDPSKATEDTTFEYAPGLYTYAGWYEVHADGTETPYDFSKHVDHDTVLKLHWKKAGIYYVAYDAGAGTLSGSQDTAAYADQAAVLISCGATAPSGYTFEGWRVRGDTSERIYRVGENFALNSEYASTVGGKSTVNLDAVYSQVGTAKIVYDANGGTLTGTEDTLDFGTPKDTTAPTPGKSVANGKATISNLVNNSVFTLSDGKLLNDSAFAFTRVDANGKDMTLAGWSTEANYKPGDPFYELGGEYGVDSEEPTTLYAVWKVTVTYHLNTASTGATWGGDWTGYTRNDSEKTYSQDVYLNNAVTEPSCIPTDSSGTLFLYWMEEPNGTAAYAFSTAVEKNLELYAAWGSRQVTAHAVDASAATLVAKGTSDGWTINNIAVGAGGTNITGTSHVTPPASSNYVFAFAAASSSLDSISEEHAVTKVTYNTAEKQVYVTYASGETAPLGNNEIYFVYYQTKALNINYKSMVAVGESSGALNAVTLNTGANAPVSTGLLGTYNMRDGITQPLTWVNESEFTDYSFAVGNANAGNAGDLHVLTTASRSNDDRPKLQIKNTWRGFQYSTDGSNWVNCGYDPVLYTIYYTQQPTIILIKEQTIGTSAVMNTQFEYQIKVTQKVTDSTDSSNPTVTESDVFSGTYTLPDNSGNNVQSAILFYDAAQNKETTQTITVTQTAKEGFTTAVDAAGKGTVDTSERKWTYTNSPTVESPTVTFTNTQSNVAVDVHVARIDTSTNAMVLDDSMRKESHSIAINPGETKTFLTELPSNTVFKGDSTVYAFGAVLYGTSDGTDGAAVTPKSLEVASVAFAQVSDNVYELVLKDSDGKDLGSLDGYNVYYLYYPMPQVRYVKLSPDGSALSAIEGSANGTSVTSAITYDQNTLSMNGTTVAQGQRFSFPMTGFRITQDVGTNTFRMPPILDDGIYARYLSYRRLGAGNADNIASLSALGEGHVSTGLTMHLRVRDNALEWSFDGEAWTAFSGTPTVYAIYEERGYDLQITKSVPVGVGTNPSFTITLESDAITKSKYGIEGYVDDTIEATPAADSTKGSITLTVVDGSSIKIKGLGQGSYTVKETGNDNYKLTAKCGPMNGSLDSVTVKNSSLNFSLDRERKLELTNTAKAICKITVSGTETPFYTLQSAVDYVANNISSKSATIEMLSDYLMPSVDKPAIPADCTIILKTANTSGGTYNFDGGSSGTASGAKITRAAGNTEGPLIASRGTLTLNNVSLNGNKVEANSAMIESSGALTISEGTLLEGAKNTVGNGGAIRATAGTVTVSSTIRNNSAVNGGAIYSEGSAVTITGTLSGNSAANGGAIYYQGSGTVGISGNASLTGNNATESGGAIYAATGTIAVSGGTLTKNEAAGNGGAIYTANGAVNVSGGTIGGEGDAENSAVNGAAIFVDTGSASFSGGSITGNTATAGGAVGIGSTSARLYFSGAASITGNTLGDDASNVYLDKDTDQIINASGLAGGASIGIYVPGAMTDSLFKNRGEPGAKFGIYTNTTGITAFSNDRLEGLTVTADTASRRLVWGKALQLQVRYIEKYSTSMFPQKTNGEWTGAKSYPSGSSQWANYYLPGNINAASSIADDIRNKGLYPLNTATFAAAFLDDGTDAISFDNYALAVNWDSSAGAWKFTKRDGSTTTGEKLVVYFAQPAYVNIENNTGFSLSISGLTLLGYQAVNNQLQTKTGYGYVYAKNGAVQDTLEPITAEDLKLGVGKSVKLLFPGGKNQTYTLSGGFNVGDTATEIPVRQTGVQNAWLFGENRASFTLSSGRTGNTNGGTVDVVFGTDKPICKIVTNATIENQSDVVTTDSEENGTAYVFASLSNAVAFAANNNLTGAKIEVLTDYLIPGSDLASIPAGLNLTFTTAIGNTTDDYNYSDNESARATISRNSDNSSSFIVVSDGANTTSLTVQNLIFDGKNFAGSIAGGVIMTKDCKVEVKNCNFLNCIANDGGGMKVEFTPTSSYENATLTVANCNFTNCQSRGKSRQGGGAIWTNACSFTLTGEKDASGEYVSGIFDSCIAIDQGGAVFHRIDWMYDETYRTNSKARITGCKFVNCQANAAGGLELDSYDIVASDCWIENCQALARNAGGFNVYIQYKPNNNPTENDDMNPPSEKTGGATKLTLSNCVLKDCTANQRGGGFRSLTHETTLESCILTNNAAGTNFEGGGISITNTNAIKGTITNCVIQNCSAKNGGAVYFDGTNINDARLTISGDGYVDADNHPIKYSSEISGNTASNCGGGVYTASSITLINTRISNNSVTESTVDNAGGLYVGGKNKDRTVTFGASEASVDTTVITGNTASGGVASNLHLMSGSNAKSVVVNCDFSVGSHIGVTNHGAATEQFGTSPNSTNSWRPYGLADPTPSKPDYYPTFVADDGSVYGILNRSDNSGKQIIWGGLPVCKITDKDGNLLYLDGAKNYPAIFDTLDNRAENTWVSAFTVLRMNTPSLYMEDGTQCPSNSADYPFYVKMLVETYEASDYIATANRGTIPGPNRRIVLTTGSVSDGSYPYRGDAGTVCTIKKTKAKGIVNSNLLTARHNIKLENIILDGGYDPASPGTSVVSDNSNELSGIKYGGMVILRDSDIASVTLGKGAVLQNYYSKKNGGAISVPTNGNVVLDGGIIRNCITEGNGGGIIKSGTGSVSLQNGASITGCRAANGGGIYANNGTVSLEGGSISDCYASSNGGGIYINNGTVSLAGGSISDCYASTNGGGVYQNNGSFNMSNGATISGCGKNADGAVVTQNGGGVYVANNRTFNMSGGFIMGNAATTTGGGIAIGGSSTKLVFSRTPYVSGNTCTASVADDNACNLELNQDKETVINTNGIWNGARIGVYVPGNRDDATPDNDTGVYKSRGGERDRFGTFGNIADASYLYGFVNDRNGLKGGLDSGRDPNTYKGIHWIKIFSLEVSKEVDSYQDDSEQEFEFKVTLTDKASDGTPAESINSSSAEPWKYGDLYFVNGIATQMVVNDGETTTLVPLKLKSGESATGERLPAGLNYTVEEVLTEEQKAVYSATPDEKVFGYVGEHAESTTGNRYLSTAAFKNVRPICKITSNNANNSGSLLYSKTTINYNWNDSGTFTEKSYDKELPAVYATLEEAVAVINSGNPKLDFKGTNNVYYEYSDNSYRIEMLSNYAMTQQETIVSGKSITLTTASASAEQFPYRGTGNAVLRRGGFDAASMFTVNGGLVLADITLDGDKDNKTDVTANGGIVNVPSSGALSVQSGAILRNSSTSGNGGAVHVAANGTMNMTGGVISLNAVTGLGKGAGIYLEESAKLNISGNPDFGGTGIYNDGSLNLTTGNIEAGTNRQDIYIAGYAGASDEDTSAASLVANGNITTGDGTIWVWAAESPHYKTLCQFAKYTSDVTDTATTLAAFRNARDKATTGAIGDEEYLYGIRKAGDEGRNVFWSGYIDQEVTFKKIDEYGNALKDAVFTLYRDPTCANAAYVSNASDDSGIVTFNSRIPNGFYYMKETGVPFGFKESSTVYLVLVGTSYLTHTEASETLWANGGMLSGADAEQLVARHTIDDGVYYGVFELRNGKADFVKNNLAASDAGIVNYLAYYEAEFKKVDRSNAALPGAQFTVYVPQGVDTAGNPLTNSNGYPLLTRWSSDGTNNLEPVTVTSADGTPRYKKADGTPVPKGFVYFPELPVGKYYLVETGYPEKNGNNQIAFYVEEDRVFQLEVKGENDFTLSEWKGSGPYTPVEKERDNYVVENKDAVCKLTDKDNNLLYTIGNDGNKLPAIYSTLEDGFEAANSADLYDAQRKQSTDARKLQVLKDCTFNNKSFEYSSSNHHVTFTTAAITAKEGDRYVFSTTRTTDASRAEIKRSYNVNNVSDANDGALITVSGANFTLQNIMLSGEKSSHNGRAFFVTEGGTLNILDNTLLQNFKHAASASSSGADDIMGGAVFMDDATTLNIDGGAEDSSAIFTGNEVVNNRTSGSAGAFGGAISIGSNCTVSIKNAQFTGNTATASSENAGNGGAISMGKAKNEDGQEAPTFTKVVFQGNAASNRGGALYASGSSSLTFDSSTFSDNHAMGSDGGALAILAQENATASLTINGGTFTSNTAASNGGALFASNVSNLTVKANSAFSSNSAGSSGGAVYSSGNGSTAINDCTFTGNHATSGSGGAVAALSQGTASPMTVSGGTFTNNTAGDNGGALYATEKSSLTIERSSTADSASTFTNNSAGNSGGALFAGECTSLTLNGSEFTSNRAPNRDGGALAAFSNGTDSFSATITGGAFTDNHAGVDGGAVKIGAQGNLSLGGNVSMSENSAHNGGAVATSTGITTALASGSISKNTATESGGAFFIGSVESDEGVLQITGGSITGNTATNGGAVFAANHAQVSVSGGGITGNNAAKGSAIFAEDYAEITVSGGSITKNIASGGEGGAINAEGSNAKLYLSGKAMIYGNTCGEAQRNVVLSAATNTIDFIHAIDPGLDEGAHIGVFVLDGLLDQHGLQGKPFGTFANNSNLAAFTNDRDAELYGVYNTKDAADDAIYWVSLGQPVAFSKVDGSGNALPGATFSLYTDAACTQPFEEAEDEPVWSVSADGTTKANSDGVLLDKGVVLFEEIPDGVYYMRERKADGSSGAPSGYEVNNTTYIVLVGDGELAAGITQDMVDAQRNRYTEDKARYGLAEDAQYAIFALNDDEAVTTPNIAERGIMNVSTAGHAAVLKKVATSGASNGTYSALPGATFEILRYDRTVVASGVSGDDGVFWVGTLPHGTYYLHETDVPDGYAALEDGDNWFTFSVDGNGVSSNPLTPLAVAP